MSCYLIEKMAVRVLAPTRECLKRGMRIPFLLSILEAACLLPKNFICTSFKKIKLIKNFCVPEDTIKGIKRQPTEWKKIFAKHISDKGLILRMYYFKSLKELE